ncbi:MAG TPA: 3-deoxy-D-manno-octulosonic acid transferase [Elusimicrobia bacterium]|nr:3-deoxy-D-manno-octulosonic acid transferase [Elusimicrobiota bacterium]
MIVLILLNALAPLAALGVAAAFLFSPRRHLLRDLPSELGERLGGLSAAARAALAGRRVLWVHAASAGEVAAVAEMLRRLRHEPSPAAVVLSTMTRAGRDAAQRLEGVDVAVLAPIDCCWTVRRFLRQTRPFALILVETELWPNMIEFSGRQGLRLALVNGRISERSFGRYRLAAPFLRPILARLDKVAAQTQADARRFMALGVLEERIAVAGNMKYDRLSAAQDERGRQKLDSLGWQGRCVLVAGSTHPGEEEIVLQGFLAARRKFPRLGLVLAPRHVERADGAAARLQSLGVKFARLSQDQPAPDCDALLVDSMGWLQSFYACASAAFVGGTLVPVGGHNVLEPAAAGAPVIFGPHVANTRETAEALISCGAGFMARDAGALSDVLCRLLAEPEFASRCGTQAKKLVRQLQGATQRSMDQLSCILNLR